MKKILIIDDETPIRTMLIKLLERNKFQVIEAIDGNQGIKLFKKHHPDLTITDLIMPEKEGLETISELKKINPDVKIIAMSGGGVGDPKTYLNIASKLGAVRAFAKPVDNNILLSAIKEIFD
ncbi:MAG: response regulator [Desulfobacteraceae bacterium]|nr:response regulator [Desulfobacteraceae bacterium]